MRITKHQSVLLYVYLQFLKHRQGTALFLMFCSRYDFDRSCVRTAAQQPQRTNFNTGGVVTNGTVTTIYDNIPPHASQTALTPG